MDIEFDLLKHNFGSEGRANELTFAQFVALPNEEFVKLLGLLKDFVVKAKLSQLREQAKREHLQPAAVLLAAPRTPPSSRRDVSMPTAINLAAHCSCRAILEEFSKTFLDQHKHYNQECSCSFVFPDEQRTSKSVIFRHFEICSAVAADNSTLMGDGLTEQLQELLIRPPTDGSFLKLYKGLSSCIHGNSWFKDTLGEVIVPYDLEISQKRFLIRYLRANGMTVVVADVNGTVRDPFPEEVETPEKEKRQRIV